MNELFPIISVVGAVTGGTVKEDVPIMMTLPLEMMVWPSDPVAVTALLVPGAEVGGAFDGLPVDGKKVNV